MNILRKNEPTAPEKAEAEFTRSGPVYVPAVDILETERDIILMAEMPGVDEKSVTLTLEQQELLMEGRPAAFSVEGKDFYPALMEFDDRTYRRAFTLSVDIDRDLVKATVKNGVLRVVLPKAEGAKARTIQIQAA